MAKDEKALLLDAQPQIKPNSRTEANLISKKLFIYLDSFFRDGWARDLDDNDICAPQSKVESRFLCEKLEARWREEKAKPTPSLCRALAATFLPELLYRHSLSIWFSEFLRFFQCFVMLWLIQSFTAGDFNMSYVWALIFGLCSVLWALCYHPSFLYFQRSGALVRIAVCSLMFKKVLRLSQPALQKSSRGHIINMMSNDVMRYDLVFLFVNHLVIGPIHCILAIYFLWPDYGYSCLGGIGVVVVLAILQSFQSRIFFVLRMMTAKRSDKRIKIVDEMINAMKTIKIYCWDAHFAKIIAAARKEEVSTIWFAQLMRALFFSTFVSGPKLITFASFVIFIANSTVSAFSPGQVFFMIALLNVTRLSCSIFLPLEMMFLSEAFGATKRIEQFLLLEEREEHQPITTNNNKADQVFPAAGSVVLSEMDASWNRTENALERISLDLSPGELLVVTGAVGSGKSTLLTSLMDELVLTSGSCKSTGRVSFCPQEAWIFVGTVRENILFGQEMETAKYERVVEAAALRHDFELLPFGDQTLIGDKGTALSGGQRARINFARAIYREADIYLLDDPFSAVDPKVGKKLANSVQFFLKGKTRVVVTHQEHYLPGGDKVLHLQNGQVSSLTSRTPELPEETSVDAEAFEDCALSSGTDDKHKFKEKNATGGIGFGLLKEYLSLRYPFYVFLFYLLFEVSTMLVVFMADIWLKLWLEDVDQFKAACANSSTANSSDCDPALMDLPNSPYYRNVYIVLSLLIPVLCALSRASYMRYMVLTNGKLHDVMTSGIMNAPVAFFERTTPGVIMNRFSKDLGQVDEMLPQVMSDAINIFIAVILILVVAAYTNIFTILLSIPLLLLFMKIRVYYIKSARQLKRLEGSLRSPVFGTLNSTINGLVVIRAFHAEDKMQNEFDLRQDRHTGAWMLFLETGRWLAFRLDIILAVYITVVAVFCPLLATYSNIDPGGIGLSLTTIIPLLGMLQWGVRQSTETENLLTSVERLLEYKDIKPETSDGKTLSDWPASGEIKMEQVCFSYNGKEDVLKNINLEIKPSERIGIVGRTGAGKSSLTSTLFRLRELRSGTIGIDGIDAKTIKLSCLRRGITLIPQEPIIFSNSVRSNLDPVSTFSDAEIWAVLDTVQMKAAVESLEGGLEYILPAGGANFSIGQRQLLCMARALLMKTKILLIDEATANVDPQTDDIIQNIIRSEFSDSTTLTIAHRINTIIDSDRILVLDSGQVCEFDTPAALLSRSDSHFSSMVDETNISSQLRKRALANS